MNDDRREERDPMDGPDAPLRYDVAPPHPPADLEARVVRSLRGRGLIAPPTRWRTRAVLAAAGVALFATGVITGRALASRPAPSVMTGERFAIFLYKDTTAARQVDIPAAEFIAWARELRAAGHRITGEELGRAARALGPPTSHEGGEVLVGFFIVEADDLSEAARLAETSPHVRQSGRVEVRPIVRRGAARTVSARTDSARPRPRQERGGTDGRGAGEVLGGGDRSERRDVHGSGVRARGQRGVGGVDRVHPERSGR